MEFIDTHAHLYLDDFREDFDKVMRNATDKGVSRIVLPNINSESIHPLHQAASSYEDKLIPLMGLHPTSVKADYREELDTILAQLDKYDYKGIGEIGIDLYWDKTFINEQVEAFEKQLTVAIELDLPVVIHARDSFPEILRSVNKYKGLRGIFHAFTGSAAVAGEITSKGFLLGIGGILTFKNSQLAEIVRGIDMEYIVLETDSPYLAPVPFRGRRNESSYVVYIAEALAKLKGISVEKVAEITTHNALSVFNL